MFRQRYDVKGRFGFPIDMLRYDESHPASERDAARIERLRESSVTGNESEIKLERVLFDADQLPCVARWKSFGWEVVAGSVTTTPI